MRDHLMLLAILSLLCHLVSPRTVPAPQASGPKKGSSAGSSASKLEAYQEALNTVADNIKQASEEADALVNKHMSAVDKDPGSLITKNAMEKLVQANSLGLQKPGTRSIMLESQQGFNGISNYQPSSWKITETVSNPEEKVPEPSSEKQNVIAYPMGVGPVLLNGCTATTEYSKTSPCYNSKLFDLQNTICSKIMDAANFIGVGFDGRGYYRAESRRSSLIQRVCAGKSTFLGQDVPDTMNVFGIYETNAETKSFQSVSEYMSYIRNKAGLSEQKNLFISEASKYSRADAYGVNLGGIGSLIGAGIGAVAGGPVGAGIGAQVGGAIGGSIRAGIGSGSGSESSTENGQSSSKVEQTDQASQKQSSAQNFFAIMYVNIVLYEISLDDVKPSDINLAAFRDYVDLPVSYYSAGAEVKFQNFLLRWGTHFVRSGKFGGQLKVIKTAKADKVHSAQEFASYAENEFQSMFATLQSKYSQESSSWGFLGFGGESKSTSQSSNAKSESDYKGTVTENNLKSQAFRQSEFTQTTVEAQGGTPEIAEALVDFYTPAFKQLFHTWITSIKDYAKPFEFQLRPINELFNLNMDAMFPAGNTDFGCVGGKSQTSVKVKILVDSKTTKRYYLDTRTLIINNASVEQKVRVDCKYSSIDEFKQEMDRRMVALERAVGIYMAEGPFPTSSFELPAGQPGCEESTLAQVRLFSTATSTPLKFAELQKQPFILAFNLPEAVPNILTPQAKYIVTYRLDRWFAVEPGQELMHLYDGCQIASPKPTDTKICFRNIILTYEESTGLFSIDMTDYAFSKLRNPLLPYWLSGTTVARSKSLFGPSSDNSTELYKTNPVRPAVPCNVKWLNSQRLDPNKSENCIHFTAATEGDLFVIFASVPRDHSTWYYLQITPEGVRFHKAMFLSKNDPKKGMGLLGDKNLFQSFFVCVIQNNSVVTMQYGKANPDKDTGFVYSAYIFPPDSESNRLSFYSFGTSDKPASLMDVRLTRQMPEVACQGTDYVKKDGKCILVCHTECKECNIARDSKSCQQCRNMRVVTLVGERKVTECFAQCPAGLYPSETQQGLCIPCVGGTYKATAGNKGCSKCAVGTSSPDEATSCTGCPAGTFSDSLGSQKCQQCPAGKFSLSGATSCTDCLVGQFSDAGQGECNPCPYGQYGTSETLSQSKCIRAPKGSYVAVTGATASQACPVGTFNNEEGQTRCKDCTPGTYAASTGSLECAKCPAGRYQPAAKQSACIQTSAGYFTEVAGAALESPCRAGYVSALQGATSCSQCPAGQFSQQGWAICSSCNEFQFAAPGSSSCTNCPNNAFVKSDKINCYRRIYFDKCEDSGIESWNTNCRKAMDSNREGLSYVSQSSGGNEWRGYFKFLEQIRIVVLWKRPDCCEDQFMGIEVKALTTYGQYICGTVSQTVTSYVMFDCNYWANGIQLYRSTRPSMSVVEVEAYGDR